MLLMPKRVKYRKSQRGVMKGLAKGGLTLNFGSYGLQALESCWMKSQQIESARIAINRSLKKGGKLWIRVFPDKPVSKKPAETRMGKGKGAPEFWVSVVKAGRIIFELEGVDEATAKAAFLSAGHKLPIKTKFVNRQVV